MAMSHITICSSCDKGMGTLGSADEGKVYYFCNKCGKDSHPADNEEDALEMWRYDNPPPAPPKREDYGTW